MRFALASMLLLVACETSTPNPPNVKLLACPNESGCLTGVCLQGECLAAEDVKALKNAIETVGMLATGQANATGSSTGPTGPTGADGLDGMDGAPGMDGTNGAQGPGGPAGGPVGPTGATGATGADGLPGMPGMQGMAGSNGTPGTPGTPGAPGRDGVDGSKFAEFGISPLYSTTSAVPLEGLTRAAGFQFKKELSAPKQETYHFVHYLFAVPFNAKDDGLWRVHGVAMFETNEDGKGEPVNAGDVSIDVSVSCAKDPMSLTDLDAQLDNATKHTAAIAHAAYSGAFLDPNNAANHFQTEGFESPAPETAYCAARIQWNKSPKDNIAKHRNDLTLYNVKVQYELDPAKGSPK